MYLDLPSYTVLSIFIPTFILVSISPGMCMTLALTLGLRIGLQRTLWMMIGELTGVGLVVVLSSIGIAGILLARPWLFELLKLAGGLYLIYLASQMWLSKGKLALTGGIESHAIFTRLNLMSQGFMTAIANPKGWAFFIALLPPFLDTSKPLTGQLAILTTLILIIEALCLLIYASGGKTLGYYLREAKHQQTLNRLSGSLLGAVGIWLMLS